MKLILAALLAAVSLCAQVVTNPSSSSSGGGFKAITAAATITASSCTVGDISFATDATAGQNIYECAATNTWTQQLNSGGANAALSNLASVSINSALLFQTGIDIGSTTKPARNAFIVGAGTYGTNYFELTGTPTSTRVLTLPDVTGTLAQLVSPSFTTPTLGAATATSVNKMAITAPATSSTLAVADGKTLTASNTLTLAGTDSTVMTFPTTSATIARTDAANTFTGHQTIEGVATAGATGTNNLVFSTSPTFITPVLGAATATSVAVGSSPPTCTIGTGGALCMNEGTAPTAASTVDQVYADSTLHTLAVSENGGAAGVLHHTLASSHQTAQTASIGTSTLCAATAGLCNQAGQYHVHWDFIETGTACSSVVAGGVTFSLTWTDTNATAHTVVALMAGEGAAAATPAVSQTFFFQTTLANAWATGDFNISTNGTIVQYATTYTACTTGTGTYQLDTAIDRLQ